MARFAIIEYRGAIYPVINRGNDRWEVSGSPLAGRLGPTDGR